MPTFLTALTTCDHTWFEMTACGDTDRGFICRVCGATRREPFPVVDPVTGYEVASR